MLNNRLVQPQPAGYGTVNNPNTVWEAGYWILPCQIWIGSAACTYVPLWSEKHVKGDSWLAYRDCNCDWEGDGYRTGHISVEVDPPAFPVRSPTCQYVGVWILQEMGTSQLTDCEPGCNGRLRTYTDPNPVVFWEVTFTCLASLP